MIKPKILTPKAEKKLRRSIQELASGSTADKVKAAKMRMQLSRARRYRFCNSDERVAGSKRRRAAARDPLLRLRTEGRISQGEFMAAEEIAEIWEALARGRDLQAASLETKIHNSGVPQGPIERLPAALDGRYRNIWKPWAADMSKLFLVNFRRRGEIVGTMSFLAVAVDVAAYRYSFSSLAGILGGRRQDTEEQLKMVFLEACSAWETAVSERENVH